MRRIIASLMAALLAGLTGAATAGPLDLKVPYTADSVIGRGENLRAGKLWRTPNAMRHEWIERGVKQNVIVRFDRNPANGALSFLGVGVPPTTPSLGTLIRVGNDFLFSGEWWIAVFPGIALVVLVLSVNLLGDWLRDALNPKLR